MQPNSTCCIWAMTYQIDNISAYMTMLYCINDAHAVYDALHDHYFLVKVSVQWIGSNMILLMLVSLTSFRGREDDTADPFKQVHIVNVRMSAEEQL